MNTAETILKMNSPGDLFTNDENKIKGEYRNLAKQWHPDVNHEVSATEVMDKINHLYKAGLDMIKTGRWMKKNFVQFHTIDRRKIGVTYLKEHMYELGKYYICNNSVLYVIDKRHQKFYDNFIDRISKLRYANDDMKTEFQKYLPKVQDQFETQEYYCIKVSKSKDVFSLRDILNFYKGVMPDRHMAWVLSSLYNMACFLDFNKLAHNGMTIDNYFISPEFHSGMLLGGWWYAVGINEKLIGAPKDVFDVMTMQIKRDKTGQFTTDLDAIRQIGRELVGDKFGNKLLSNTTIPKPIIDWLLGGSLKKPVEEYTLWGQTLERGYGKRTFVEMKIADSDIYPK